MSDLNKVLLASKNSLWAKDLKKKLTDSKKVVCDISYDRTDAIEKVSATEYDLIVFENSFEIKNIEVIARALDNSNGLVPASIIFSLVDIRNLQSIEIPEKLKDSCCAYSVPLSVDVFCDIILNRFLTITATNENQSSLDKEFVSLLVTSTSEVLRDFTLLDFKALKPKLLSSFDPYPEVGIRGKVVIRSKFFTGSFLVSFPNSTFFKIYESVVGEKITAISKDEEDFASSITNMIYGKMKKFLSEKGVGLDMVIPTIDTIETLSCDDGPIFVIPFESVSGKIYIKIALNHLD